MSSLDKTHKIFLLADQLSKGGAERSAAFLSKYLASKNIVVKIMVNNDEIEYEYAGEVLNLGKIRANNTNYFNKFRRLYIFYKFIKSNRFDYIIDFRMKRFDYQEFLFAVLLFKSKLIVTIHSYMISYYFPQNKFLAKRIYKKAYKIVTVATKINSKIISDYNYDSTQIQTIYNPIDLEYITIWSNVPLEIEYDYIIGIGSMGHANVKQFDKLIESYLNSILPERGIKLMILGDGVLKKKLEAKVEKLNRSNDVVFTGFVDNPYKFMKNAKFMVLASKFEGFPMVLIETLACGTPVVAFDCFSGPSEIISQGKNGLLVENQNFEKLTEAINTMVSDKELYHVCQQNSKNSVAQFSLEAIGKEWLNLMGLNI
ncbi:glycosyltransferase [Flavobacterium agrisoli]|uniref:Glycosyltransferase n=1 Tax=Flavobacterium agrisoli TaxID=2793066 RepID=A0A934PKU0_9FLAO|nr:glycosyltransferase [Flavobacterium agrisoli]MBK0368753.1 glycosyltransferase [Flavobacterium agrisoli]